MQECCSCPISADGLRTISVINDLTSNPQFSSPGVGVIKLVTTIGADPLNCTSDGNGVPGIAGTLLKFYMRWISGVDRSHRVNGEQQPRLHSAVWVREQYLG
jgi:hypothetical protein